MAEEEKKGEAAGAGAKGGAKKEEDEDPGWCFYYGQVILKVFKAIFITVKTIISAICETLSLCWYPFKERTADCCDCCGKRM